MKTRVYADDTKKENRKAATRIRCWLAKIW